MTIMKIQERKGKLEKEADFFGLYTVAGQIDRLANAAEAFESYLREVYGICDLDASAVMLASGVLEMVLQDPASERVTAWGDIGENLLEAGYIFERCDGRYSVASDVRGLAMVAVKVLRARAALTLNVKDFQALALAWQAGTENVITKDGKRKMFEDFNFPPSEDEETEDIEDDSGADRLQRMLSTFPQTLRLTDCTGEEIPEGFFTLDDDD